MCSFFSFCHQSSQESLEHFIVSLDDSYVAGGFEHLGFSFNWKEHSTFVKKGRFQNEGIPPCL